MKIAPIILQTKTGLLLIITLLFLQSSAQCWRTLSASLYSTYGIKTDGTMWACGMNSDGQLGDGTLVSKTGFVQIGSGSAWSAVEAGFRDHVLALKPDGTLWAWGKNNAGQLGDGTTVDKLVPVKIGTDTDWKEISAGAGFSFAIKQNGTLWAWGYNLSGNFGDSSYVSSLVPIQVGTDVSWKNVSAGAEHCLALKANGSLWAWGQNLDNQLGTGTLPLSFNYPKQIGTAKDWKIIEGGRRSSFAINQAGYLFAWGSCTDGTLGDSCIANMSVPTQIGAEKWKSISSLGLSIGIKEDGTLWAWGKFMMPTSSKLPMLLSNATDWHLTKPGNSAGTALKTDGSFWSWGGNQYGELGSGSLSSAQYPTNFSCITTRATTEIYRGNNIIVYPNPAENTLNLKNITEEVTISILSMSGVTLLKESGVISKVNVQSLAPGAYIIRVENNTIRYNKVFIKSVE